MNNRLDRIEYGLAIAMVAAVRSTCSRRHVGAVLMNMGRVLSTGYNGSPIEFEHCNHDSHTPEDDPLMFNGGCINTIHAEMNALMASKEKGTHLICTDQPCLACLKAALAHNPEILIHYWRDYKDEARDKFVEYHQVGNMEKISEDHVNEIKMALDMIVGGG